MCSFILLRCSWFHNRSLAALADERDRALRALAVEEEKRCKIVDELSGVLGDELTAGDVSRITIGLEALEVEWQVQDERGGREEEVECSYGRAWLIEVRAGRRCMPFAATRQCLRYRNTWYCRLSFVYPPHPEDATLSEFRGSSLGIVVTTDLPLSTQDILWRTWGVTVAGIGEFRPENKAQVE